NGPIDVDVDEFLDKLKKSAGSAAKGNYAGAVAAAMSKLGSPYSWGAAGPDAFDCSGLMVWAYQQIGKSIPRTSQAQLSGGQSVSTSDLQPGDIVAYYPGATHVGMYIGDGQLVHASDYGIPVPVVPVDSMPIVGAVRYSQVPPGVPEQQNSGVPAPRVLVVTNDLPPTHGGTQTDIRASLNALVTHAGIPAENIVVFASTQNVDAAAEFDAGVDYRVVRWPRKIMLPTPQVARRMRQLIREYRIETV